MIESIRSGFGISVDVAQAGRLHPVGAGCGVGEWCQDDRNLSEKIRSGSSCTRSLPPVPFGNRFKCREVPAEVAAP